MLNHNKNPMNAIRTWEQLCHPMTLVLALTLFFVEQSESLNGQDLPVQRLQMGVAEVDITPRLGTPMAGYYSPRGADGVHDPLMAKAMVLDDGTTKLALVSLDIIKTTPKMVADARELIATRVGIQADAVLIAATHSHTGPVIVNESKRENDLGGSSSQAQEFATRLPEWIAQSVEAAVKSVEPINLSLTTGHCKGVAFNRRFHLRNGAVGWNPGKLNPLIVRAAGPVDEDLPIMLFTGIDGKRKAGLINYSIHLDTVGGTKVSADIPGDLARILKETVNPDFFSLYFTACCGDVNHIDVSRGGTQKGHTEAARIATILAASTLTSLELTKPVQSLRLAHRSRRIQLPTYRVTEEEITAARELLERKSKNIKPDPTFREVVAAYRAIDIADHQHQPWEVEVQVFSIGNQAAIVSLPGEIFVELGLTIRQGSPFPLTAIAELANGSIGYIPNRVAYPQGEYEVISARCAEGSGEMLVDTALEMLDELYKDQVNRQ